MGKLTNANMKKQLRTIHDCGSNDSVSGEDAKVKIETSYSDDKKDTREMFYSNNSKNGYNRGNNSLIREVVVILSYNTKRERENRRNVGRKNPLDKDGNRKGNTSGFGSAIQLLSSDMK